MEGGGCLSRNDFSSASFAAGAISQNKGGSEGGAMRATGSTAVTVTGATANGNAATGGGGFAWVEMQARLTLRRSRFANNLGAFYVSQCDEMR